jgi:diguanylate cyclase (GGDEF)-like protein/PAS domain S-box-containing protein
MHKEMNPLKYIQKDEKNYLINLIALCPDGVIAIDRPGTIIIFNRAAEMLTGHPAKDVLGKRNIAEIYPSPDIARKIKSRIYSEEHGGTGTIKDYEVEILSQDGRTIPIRLSATLIFENGEEIGSVGFFHDLTTRKQMEDKLRQLSITDSLTGLYNQRYFHTCLTRELERALRYHRTLSLICFDLDGFKECNDVLGHLEGDNILRLVGDLLPDIVRQSDLTFRYGGDEFFVLLPEADLKSAKATGEKIKDRFNEHWPYEINDKDDTVGRVTLSIGVAELGTEETSESIVKRADVAMYEAKRRGGDRVVAAADPAA